MQATRGKDVDALTRAAPKGMSVRGQTAGRYELLSQIARGGMGSVWVARLRLDNGFEKLFAVKTLLAHLSEQEIFRTMFLDEARLAASIEHPNVAQILDMGEEEHQLYLVMEWIEGVSLNELARIAYQSDEMLPHGLVLRVLADACVGLHAIHEHTDRHGAPLDIVHRDMSPHNILVSAAAGVCVEHQLRAAVRHSGQERRRASDHVDRFLRRRCILLMGRAAPARFTRRQRLARERSERPRSQSVVLCVLTQR